VKVLTE